MICVVLILVTGFSRNYLGVHTPQDVVVSVILTALCVYLCQRLLQYLDAHPSYRIPAILLGAMAGIIVLVYLDIKPYPMQCDSSGTLLVDPFRTKAEVFQCIGKWLGFLAGLLIDLKYVRYSIPEKKAFAMPAV